MARPSIAGWSRSLGSVFLLYGSMAYTKITAKINVFVKHTANSALTAGQDIVIEKSVVGSVLRAGRKVISESDDASIVGGRVEAGQEVSVGTIGNSSGTETLVYVTSSRGQIRFSAVYPGVRLKIADLVLSVPAVQGARRGGYLRGTAADPPLREPRGGLVSQPAFTGWVPCPRLRGHAFSGGPRPQLRRRARSVTSSWPSLLR